MTTRRSQNSLSSGATYEALYAELQGLVAKLEVGDLPLDDSLALYERGVVLAGACQQLLDSAELRVRQLQGESFTDMAIED